MKLKKYCLCFMTFAIIIATNLNYIQFNVYADNYDIKNNYKFAMAPSRVLWTYTYTKPYSRSLVEEWILEEAQKVGLELSEPESNFSINKCFFLRMNTNEISDADYLKDTQYPVYYLNNIQVKPTYVDYKNKIAIIIQDKNYWYNIYSENSYVSFNGKSQMIKEECTFIDYCSEDDYYVIPFYSTDFTSSREIKHIKQFLNDIFTKVKNYNINFNYCNIMEKEMVYETYEQAYEYTYNQVCSLIPKDIKYSSPYDPPSTVKSSFKFTESDNLSEINNCFAIFYDKSYDTYYNKVAAYDMYTTRYYLRNINIIPDFIDTENKVAILLYDKEDWDNIENDNPDYFVDKIKNRNTKVLKTENEYKNYLNNNSYYLIVLNRENFTKSFNGFINHYPLLLNEMCIVIDKYRF